jgi:hypothetical protein
VGTIWVSLLDCALAAVHEGLVRLPIKLMCDHLQVRACATSMMWLYYLHTQLQQPDVMFQWTSDGVLTCLGS